jgi:hypothetical protein
MNEELIKKVFILSQWVLKQSAQDTSLIIKGINEGAFDLVDKNILIKESTRGLIGHEFMFLYLNLIDRYSYSFLKNDRNDFQNYVVKKVLEDLGIEMDSDFIDIYNNRQDEFSKYKKLMGDPDKGESPQDGLFWEFGKHISEIVSGLPNNVFIISASETLAVHAWADLTSLNFFNYVTVH